MRHLPTPRASSRRMILSRTMLCGAFLAMLCVTGCSDDRKQPEGAKPAASDSAAGSAVKTSGERIVVLGGPLAEIVYGLGAGDQVIGSDITCMYPPAVVSVTKVGYQRTIAAEQVLSLNPTLIIASDEAGPPTAMEQLRGAGVRVEVIKGGHTPEAARERIMAVAKLLGREAEGRKMVDSLDKDLAAFTVDSSRAPRVMYLHSRGGGNMYAAGGETSADAIIRLAGGVNAVSGYTGYRPFTPEAGLDAAPDYIMVSAPVLEQVGGADVLLKQPGLAGTPAAEHRRVIPVDDLYMLGFGPRLGKARADLASAFKGEAKGAAK